MNKKKLLIIIGAIIIVIIATTTALLLKNKKPTNYKVYFETNGGSSVETQIVAEGGKVKKPDDPTKDGYMFIEWTHQGVIYDFSLEVTSNITLVAKWAEVDKEKETYIIKFNSDGGTTISNQIVEKGNKVKKPVDPTKDGYTFKGWTLNDVEYDFETTVEKDIELKAKWEKNKESSNQSNKDNGNNNKKPNPKPTPTPSPNPVTPAEKKYTVKFNSDGGSAVSSQSVVEGGKASKPADPTKDGYTFIGWTLDGATYNFDTKITKEIELTAKWLKNPTIQYTAYGNTATGVTADVGIDYPSYEVGEESILSGWELYVTSDDAEGDEAIIDGIGYFLHSTNGKSSTSAIDVEFGNTHRYRARVFIDTDSGRVYSNWSNIIEIKGTLKTPRIIYTALGNIEGGITADIGIDYPTYFDEEGESILTGWELYVTSEDAEGDEMFIDGIGYFLHSTNGNDVVSPVEVDNGDIHRYRARVFKDTAKGRIYSGWSNIIELSAM